QQIRTRVGETAVRTWSGSFSASESETRLVSSAGFDASLQSTQVSWHVTFNGEIGDGFAARRLEPEAEFAARLARLGELAAWVDRPAPAMTAGTHPVILHPRVVEDYVLETLLHHLEGSTVAHGEGRFRRDEFGAGEPRLREDLGLRLDPLQPYRSGSYRFTSEGLPAARCTYIERGRLVQPLLDLKYAHRLGLAPTPLPAALDTLELSAAEIAGLPEALGAAAGGALVLAVLGVHTQDSASGRFSLAAPQVLRLGDDGRIAGRMRATISGSLFDVLSSDALRLVAFPGETTPGMLFPCRLDPK
ncbi:MAG TPA: metallopeptidase TldD-related protein, partial [Candidatus Polarisedimenticolaceae bacterium]|nr:metallopeptidase TldD-related protein [Candidatus Polarisedimenticolaceae bacterium]